MSETYEPILKRLLTAIGHCRPDVYALVQLYVDREAFTALAADANTTADIAEQVRVLLDLYPQMLRQADKIVESADLEVRGFAANADARTKMAREYAALLDRLHDTVNTLRRLQGMSSR